MKPLHKIVVQECDFDLSVETALAYANNTNMGALVSFVGLVRDADDTPLTKMTLEHYPGMTEKALASIAHQAQERWELGSITIIHRVGDLKVGEQIVLVMTTSKHRKSAFESCEFIMDYLKSQAPFWKKEHSESGAKWVAEKASDNAQTKRWD